MPSTTNTDPIAQSSVEPATIKLRLTKPHRLIQRCLEKPKTDSWGNVYPSRHPAADVRVDGKQRRLALCVLDRLIKAIEHSGLDVDALDEHAKRGTFAIDGHDMAPFYITEERRQVEHVPTEAELRKKESESNFRIPKTEQVSTGRFILNPGGIVDLSSEQAIEQVIQKSISALRETIQEQKADRIAAHKRQQEEYKRTRDRQEAEGRIKAFHASADALFQYDKLMRYIEEVRRFGKVPDNQREEGQSLDEWLSWAEWQARLVHPLG